MQQIGPGKLIGHRDGSVMSKWVRFATVALLSLTSLAVGQSVPAPSGADRRITSRVFPDYPELARRMHIHGVVKVAAVVRANGSVKSARVLGGHPVLVDAAVTAVAKWKFQPAQAETTEVVLISFESQ
jgi:protein TonB